MSMKIWWVANIVWILVFGALAFFVGARNIDGAGVIQTPEIKMVTYAILGIAFIVVVLVQLIFLYFVRKISNNNSIIRPS